MEALFAVRGWCASFLGWLVTPSERAFIDGEKRRKARALRAARTVTRG